MSTDQIALLIVSVMAITLGSIALALLIVRLYTRRRLHALQARIPDARLLETANFFGQESRGVRQMRGLGVLALREDSLYFERLAPRAEYTIQLARITGLDTPKVYLGKTYFRPLLKVTYLNDLGRNDSMAWAVRDVAVWKARLPTPPEIPPSPVVDTPPATPAVQL